MKSEDSRELVWHQVFSNYHNMNFEPNGKKEILRLKQNISAKQISVELSNQYDGETLNIESIKVSLTDNFSDAVSLTLNGDPKFVVQPYTRIWTDNIEFKVSSGHELYFEIEVSNESNKLATSANLFSDAIIKSNVAMDKMNFLYGITSVAFVTDDKVKRMGFFGDSLTNQAYFSDATFKYLSETDSNLVYFDAGISGNRLLLPGTAKSQWRDSFGRAGVERFNEDVISYRPDILVSLIGINDLFHPGTGCPISELPTLDKMISGYKQIMEISKLNKIVFIPLTISPFAGSTNQDKPAWSLEKEQLRLGINEWIMRQPNAIDITKIVANPENSEILDSKFNIGDNIHFSKNGGDILGKYLATEISEKFQV